MPPTLSRPAGLAGRIDALCGELAVATAGRQWERVSLVSARIAGLLERVEALERRLLSERPPPKG